MRITGAVLETSGAESPFADSRPLTVGELELDPPGPGELLVRIEVAGVCHSDLSVVDGNRVRPTPMLLGHEAAGIVEGLGDGVTDLSVGDRVVMTFLPRCGECAGCATGGRLPCERGSASNNAGTLLGGASRLSRGGHPVFHHLGVSAFASHAVVKPCVRRAGGCRHPSRGRRTSGLRGAHGRRCRHQRGPAPAGRHRDGGRPRRSGTRRRTPLRLHSVTA